MLVLKIFVQVQSFWRRPFMPSHNFCHPVFDKKSFETYYRRCPCGGQISSLCRKMVTKVIILRLKMTVVNHWLSLLRIINRRTCSTEVVILEYQGSSLVHCWAPWPGSPVAANWRTTLTFNTSRLFTWVHMEARMPDTWFSSLVSSPVMHQCHLLSPS